MMKTYSARVAVTPGSWHVGGAGSPSEAAAMGQHLTSWNRAHDIARSGGFNRRIAQMAAQKRPAAAPAPAPLQAAARPPVQTQMAAQQPLYSAGQTQRLQNRAFGQAMQQADPRFAQQGLMGRGMSLDQGTLAAATPGMSEGISNGLLARNVLPLQDALANQQWALQGQQMQGQEFIGLAQLLRQMQQNQMARQQTAMGPLLQAAMG